MTHMGKIHPAGAVEGEIVTVRRESEVMTRQRLPNFVGISQATAGSTGINMNLVVSHPAARPNPTSTVVSRRQFTSWRGRCERAMA